MLYLFFNKLWYIRQSCSIGFCTGVNCFIFTMHCLSSMIKGAFSFAKINCHRNFGKVFAFTHSNEKLKRNFVEESLLTYFVT